MLAIAGLLIMGQGTAASETEYRILEFSDLNGWADDDHQAALDVFLNTCKDMDDPDWRALCALAADQKDARVFFELFFRPVLIDDGNDALFTGYFEPELDGDLYPSARYRYPVYRMPPEAKAAGQWLTRREIEISETMQGRGLEIAWVDDPVELFFLQIQGSGRIRLPGGQVIRVGYAGSNGRDYRSIGVELVRRGVYNAHQVSADVIKNWVRPQSGRGARTVAPQPVLCVFSQADARTCRQRSAGRDEPVDHCIAVDCRG